MEKEFMIMLLVLVIALGFLILVGVCENKSSSKKPSNQSRSSQKPMDIEDKW